ncbi:PREDICTED: UDP-glucuronosyltransferase 2A3-like [Papilio polytes]|uniref:UDP-glucuronosyltransferase 2A3-like n=1 Tax=Papilio polytes TaxID=76194 RepID=UPI000675EE79|nr:PREDICTED: UDP-glucuronosyltransferase 2A3-like [Papilio polytes]
MSLNIAEDLENTIREMLTNTRYAERARELSRMYHERVAPARAEVAHWAAHVAGTRGAPHLRSPALALPVYQKLYLDAAAALALLLAAAALALRRALSLMRNKIKAYTKKIN